MCKHSSASDNELNSFMRCLVTLVRQEEPNKEQQLLINSISIITYR